MLYFFLQERLKEAISAVLPGADTSLVAVQPCPDPKFGDYQASALMALGKALRKNPRELAQAVSARLDVQEWFEPAEIAGPGFLNFRLKAAAVERALESAVRGEHLFFRTVPEPECFVVDFSSPNVAKPMHVGHIRSTILGDCLARVLRLLGHRVITDNHVGDWGTQFGKLLVGWKERLNPAALEQAPLEEMERLYKEINDACEADPAVLERARQELVKLQSGDPENRAIWERMIALSQEEFSAIYRRLGVKFDFTLGESFYNDRLKGVVQALLREGLATESEGAVVVFFPDDPELKEHPALIQKSDGAANYMTTDLATLGYRMETWAPDEIVYVTDGRQQLHFKQLFAIFRRWHPKSEVRLVHVWFGAILGEDGKPFRTRSGETIRLSALLDEAEERAYAVVSEKNPELSEEERREVARIVGIGAIKYADLLPNRQSDYVFSWDKMLALNGNSAPYLMNAFVRIRSIFRKLESEGDNPLREPANVEIRLSTEEEMQLSKHLLLFGLVLEAVAREFRPNFLCNYLYELAGRFARFYESCPVLKAPEKERISRLALCDLTARVLGKGLEVLGIETPERM